MQYLALTTHHFLRNNVFDYQGFGLGFAAIIGGVGAALGLKKDTPTQKEE